MSHSNRQFEYKYLTTWTGTGLAPSRTSKMLTEHGKEGWRIISVHHTKETMKIVFERESLTSEGAVNSLVESAVRELAPEAEA